MDPTKHMGGGEKDNKYRYRNPKSVPDPDPVGTRYFGRAHMDAIARFRHPDTDLIQPSLKITMVFQLLKIIIFLFYDAEIRKEIFQIQ